GRTPGQMRPVSIQMDVQKWAAASLIYKQGDTHVLCSATIEDRVPPHLRGKGTGWVTAEYAMLPAATSERMRRESVRGKLGGRTYEIQRLIGRSLRGVVNTAVMGEKTVVVDCDVLQADGGTRCASITGGYIALVLALRKAKLERAIVSKIAAISVGIVEDAPLLDLEYREDSGAEVDFNVVGTDAGTYIELQGTAEGKAFDRSQMDALLDLADGGLKTLFGIQEAVLKGESAATGKAAK
ncbi:MAG: ribonuclease PH, partial [Planctomycetota bacterium]